ncbi:class I SAM-dependent methyltransferase [Enterovibrio norvegicus]|uniref:class I SAM-dependent methyltransferase n=1 Tax=Enterovibrio norvegicus TaxID=188144 RepID=UPI0035512D81
MGKNKSACCSLCTSETQQILIERPDYECGLETKFEYRKCLNPNCGLVFANVPIGFDLGCLYESYSTHSDSKEHRLSFISKIIPEEISQSSDEWNAVLDGRNRNEISVLDFGCGNGNFLDKLRCSGIKNIYGYDFDSKALEIAKTKNCNILESIDTSIKFDVVFMNHVIEHISDPLSEIEKIRGILKEGGVLYITTPNTNSITRRIFRDRWRGWETPRHVNMFNTSSAKMLLSKSGYSTISSGITTRNSMFIGIYNESFIGCFWKSKIGKLLRWFILVPVSWIVYFSRTISISMGEEIVMLFRCGTDNERDK